MKTPSRVALQLLLAAGAVVTTSTVASAEQPPPCKGWATAAEHAEAGPVQTFDNLCNTAGGTFKQGWPIKWGG